MLIFEICLSLVNKHIIEKPESGCVGVSDSDVSVDGLSVASAQITKVPKFSSSFDTTH